MRNILKSYGLDENSLIQPLTSGLINKTLKVTDGDKNYVLQQINVQVFKNPYHLADNIRMIDQYLKAHYPEYLFVAPVTNADNTTLYHDKDEGYFRLFKFIEGSHTIDVADTAEQAFEAAYQFGKFTRLLSGFDATRLHITIPDFHNLTLRYRQFENALKIGNAARIRQSRHLVKIIQDHTSVVDKFEQIRSSKEVRQRVTHHDTKISNVLFDQNGKGMCVIDLDTTMPGYFISDVGDMMRTYLSPSSEEVKEFDTIEVREDFFSAIVHGYVSIMGDELTPTEKDLIFYSGLFLIYMQALRFLTDYFNNDVYYGARYEEHNFVRAGNQLQLLRKMDEKKSLLESIVRASLK
jgi:Ser/Thr protein kinase RdoA (MazF antagonist)